MKHTGFKDRGLPQGGRDKKGVRWDAVLTVSLKLAFKWKTDHQNEYGEMIDSCNIWAFLCFSDWLN